ncbi:nuclear RNase [Scheffersomyces xylosifermentans]|uniref:nuclear RNase n=1 Tax=Scheffersomyces xylosifermentans TaxID=1304137 RepID=UPI00315CA9EE
MPPKGNINAKKAKLYNSRTIRTQLSDPSFTEKEKLNIADFLRAREFEISSFERSQLNTKYASSTRVFQNLPRTMRRRTASHNVKRIPSRLRSRALREMQNSTNGVPPKKKRSRGRQIYELQVRRKLLKCSSLLKKVGGLPNDKVYGNSNIRSKIQELTKQIKELESSDKERKPLNNEVGSYDNTGINAYASRPRGNIKYYKRQKENVWLPTHIWHAKRFHLIKQHGYQIPQSPTQKCFKSMNRQNKKGAVIFDTSYYDTIIVEIKGEEEYKSLLLNITKYKKRLPDSFLNGTKTYNNWIYLGDETNKVGKAMIYSNLSINKILVRVYPSLFLSVFEYLKSKVQNYFSESNIYDCRYSLGSIDLCGPQAIPAISKVLHIVKDQNPASLKVWKFLASSNDSGIVPVGTTIAFEIWDPRLWKKPTRVPPPQMNTEFTINDLVVSLNEGNCDGINKTSIEHLLSSEGRTASYKDQLSIKAISKEFNKVSPLTNSIQHKEVAPSRIPVLVSKIGQNKWTIIVPWYWVLPIWISAVHVRQVLPGGLKQLHQFNFESLNPTFPHDFPFLADGWFANEALGKLNEAKYSKLKKSSVNTARPDFEDPDLFSPFNCDWTAIRNFVFLRKLSKKSVEDLAKNEPTYVRHIEETVHRELNSLHDIKQQSKEISNIYTGTTPLPIPIALYNKNIEFHAAFVAGSYEIENLVAVANKQLPVIQIAIELVNKGTISDGARLYFAGTGAEPIPPKLDHFYTAGFATSGAYNLSEGHATAIGLIRADVKLQSNHNFLFIRNIGKTTFHLAKFHEI